MSISKLGECFHQSIPTAAITIMIRDASENCPDNYQRSNDEWNAGVFTKVMD